MRTDDGFRPVHRNEAHPLCRESVDVRRLAYLVTVVAERGGREVVGNDKEDFWLSILR